MEAVIKIIEENIPEVIIIIINTVDVCDIVCWKISDKLAECAYACLSDSFQLTCLNLSNNRIHKLDELAELVTKVPNLKTLNLSHNEVKLAAQLILENNSQA